ncbi:hypothetical protein Poli38472_013637 [Pythium oligandrum]|uniref:Auxiliary Activity family 9 catalytic domain-containing protein n=1 Tax=Pythium oligandrum TaxID=41045 RepID=A0A8K1CDQ7_PYTOL|nr:hypothetical protein Poli38472_013636 [Pythium oligandrum]TMW61174.1 hypothetical protein Poli38472_013637 [Pythium oligandrum]|eukprot:TMW61173.1 hypothetical protein Poli38472_013636 [Pythium oligandrum]
MKSALYLATFATSLLATDVHGHGYMTKPVGRSGSDFSDMKNTAACDRSNPGKVTEFKAGEEITVEWSRNNHLGGFIRYSMVPRNQATKANFDKNTFFYTCRETNCTLKKCKDKWCGDDAGSKDHEIKCSTKVKLPDYLPSGDYVMQWTWHSAGSSYGNVGWNTGNYKTCADIRLTTSGSGSKPKCPPFVGGDRVTALEKKSSDQCWYFDNNDLSTKEVKYGTGWNNKEGMSHYKYGLPKEIEQCGGGATKGSGPAPAPAPAPAPGPAPTPPTNVTTVPTSAPSGDGDVTQTYKPSKTPKPSNAAPAPAPGKNGGGKYKYVGPERADSAAMTQWCNYNCPAFCPSDICA